MMLRSFPAHLRGGMAASTICSSLFLGSLTTSKRRDRGMSMRMLGTQGVAQELPPSLYNFGFQNENPRAELEMVGSLATRLPSTPLRILCIGSCGTTCLTMASHPSVAHIDVVDVHPAQVKLSELNFAAARVLDLRAFCTFMGVAGTGEDRVIIWDKVLRNAASKLLSKETFNYWSEHIHDVMVTGTAFAGGAEKLVKLISPVVASKFEQVPKEKLTYHHLESLTSQQVHDLFRKEWTLSNVEKSLAGPLPPGFSEKFVSSSVPTVAELVYNKLQSMGQNKATPDHIDELYFFGTIPSSFYPSHRGVPLPPFLNPAVYLAAAKRLNSGQVTASFSVGPIQEVGPKLVQAAKHKYHLVDLSNILDMLQSPDQFLPVIETMKTCLHRPGGAILLRYTSSTDPSKHILDEVFKSAGLIQDAEVDKKLRVGETSFIGNEIKAGFLLR